ncbi:glycosyltransferase family A protein [Lacinutrix jangbogonensis]|uniref:glycosyltransferase family A protein n=1 Tax=Lacinutrix jangbogonensis TaxID=1469557 RepID=UPI00053EA6FE|nr:glycosyltransferase family A protein [Lacinutrix jangbogonensis]
MSNATKTNLKLEILLSTMNRVSLDFLVKLFPNESFQDYNLLIINQTTGDRLLESKLENIRVINSFQKGLTNSRNLALENATGPICLIADDDAIYHSNFEKSIINSFNSNTDADVITFKMKDLDGNDFKSYTESKWHTIESLRQVNSVVIAFKLKRINDNNLRFNKHFGLGSTFETADEYIFLRDCLKAGLKLWFQSNYILSHDVNSSGKASGSDRLIFARSALFYKYDGIKGYLKLLHYLFLIKRDKLITNKDFFDKLKIGLQGISTYKKLLKAEQQTRS